MVGGLEMVGFWLNGVPRVVLIIVLRIAIEVVSCGLNIQGLLPSVRRELFGFRLLIEGSLVVLALLSSSELRIIIVLRLLLGVILVALRVVLLLILVLWVLIRWLGPRLVRHRVHRLLMAGVVLLLVVSKERLV